MNPSKEPSSKAEPDKATGIMAWFKENPSALLLTTTIAALGGVLGDLGTSILYTYGEVFYGPHPIPVTENNVLGVMSIIFWTLLFSPTIKYLILAFRANHHGEGGPYALKANLNGWLNKNKGLMVLGFMLILSANFINGEAGITSSLTVSAAVEGLAVVFPVLKDLTIPVLGPITVPITILILLGIAYAVSKGTETVSLVAGPIIVIFLACAGVLGFESIINAPRIFLAINPYYAITFLYDHGIYGSMIILGGAVLCYTGGEGFFGDMGHYGAKALRAAWTYAYPLLLLNYFGQGAYLLTGKVVENNSVYYSSMPEWAQGPMIPITTLAAIIASFTMILAAMSLARAAVEQGYIPPMQVIHMNEKVEGQIYVPAVNWAICALGISLIIIFQTSLRLAGAYGMSVTAVMTTTCLAIAATGRLIWKWSWVKVIVIMTPFLIIDFVYFASNLLKLPLGGYVAFIIGGGLFTLNLVWSEGRKRVAEAVQDMQDKVGAILQFPRFEQTVIALASNPITNLDSPLPIHVQSWITRYKRVPNNLIFLHVIRGLKDPVAENERFSINEIANGIKVLTIRFYFFETPDIKPVLAQVAERLEIPEMNIQRTFWVGDDNLIITGGFFHRLWMRLYKLVHKNSTPIHAYLGLAENQDVDRVTVHIRV